MNVVVENLARYVHGDDARLKSSFVPHVQLQDQVLRSRHAQLKRVRKHHDTKTASCTKLRAGGSSQEHLCLVLTEGQQHARTPLQQLVSLLSEVQRLLYPNDIPATRPAECIVVFSTAATKLNRFVSFFYKENVFFNNNVYKKKRVCSLFDSFWIVPPWNTNGPALGENVSTNQRPQVDHCQPN